MKIEPLRALRAFALISIYAQCGQGHRRPARIHRGYGGYMNARNLPFESGIPGPETLPRDARERRMRATLLLGGLFLRADMKTPTTKGPTAS